MVTTLPVGELQAENASMKQSKDEKYRLPEIGTEGMRTQRWRNVAEDPYSHNILDRAHTQTCKNAARKQNDITTTAQLELPMHITANRLRQRTAKQPPSRTNLFHSRHTLHMRYAHVSHVPAAPARMKYQDNYQGFMQPDEPLVPCKPSDGWSFILHHGIYFRFSVARAVALHRLGARSSRQSQRRHDLVPCN